MNVSLQSCRRILLACAAALVVVALVVALGVIPPVQTDTFPGSTPASAVPAFWVHIGLSVLAAGALAAIGIWSKGRSWVSTSALVALGLLAVFLGFALFDAALAYIAEGPAMQTAAILLFICAAVDSLAGVAVIITAFLRPRKE